MEPQKDMNRLAERQKQLPGVCIFGTGEYYRKLEQGLKKEFRILGAFNESAPNIIRQLESLTPDAILILTPNATHYQILDSVVRLNIPVLVEKPAVVNRDQLHDLEQLVQKHPRI